MERVFQSLKDEGLPKQPPETREQATTLVTDYFEMVYNSQRRHSTLGYPSPNMFFEAQAAGRRPEETQAWLEGGSDSDGQI